MITVRPATAKDVERVFRRLSDVTKAELEEGRITVELAKAVALDAVGFARMYFAEVDGKPLFLFWFYPNGRLIHTNFVSTVHCPRYTKAVIRVGRAIMRMCTRGTSAAFTAYTYSPHPRAEKWLNLLGFHRTGLAGKAKIFEYRPM